MFFLERKETYYMPNILGNASQPVPTYRWKQIAVCEEKEPLEKFVVSKDYRIVSNNNEGILWENIKSCI